jgi:hypothetical protein
MQALSWMQMAAPHAPRQSWQRSKSVLPTSYRAELDAFRTILRTGKVDSALTSLPDRVESTANRRSGQDFGKKRENHKHFKDDDLQNI